MEHIAHTDSRTSTGVGSVSGNRNQEKLRANVFDILHPKFYHPYATIKKRTLIRISAPDLAGLYSFLVEGIIGSDNPFPRPECPVKSPNQQSLARVDYKSAMVDYICGFGYKLTSPPCDYPPAFLEALANYLEHKVGRGGKSDNGKVIPIWNEK
ncbi:MAG: hypothetical protein PHH16_03375 [Candidatus Gracilibacteria bacterium]|nr:hypothetical protein [Candidatus Gracilibacteria bacterium]